ncbi:MAG: Ig-like domain-containing protein [Methanobacteriaceae archaeon]|nr:Ig-like domain-containing protein [Methanobacteriaceae archaeon]MDP2835414.1 Ig-like domain-containing protein [Methanobacteriaceae archaeon]MDP3033611.1 Ig-like domain-containing protein [Methanobacteriaceae archaeon]MDP3486225.1 Ig-like domain-containing protein [Methanobacteriaceae archaeon]MDP3624136.1 Ig-like domain-containing protein [Methanobacteriaceae archaeon]
MVNGIAQSTLHGGIISGLATVLAKVDNETVHSFVNIGTIAPKITYTYPKNYATKKSRTATLYFKFSENIKASTNWSKIYIKNLKTGKKVSIRKWISGRTLYIKTTSKRSAYRWYLIYVPYKAVKDYAGNNLPTSRIIKFKTGR